MLPVTAKVWFHPHETVLTQLRPWTWHKIWRSSVSPSPSWPLLFQPHMNSLPLSENNLKQLLDEIKHNLVILLKVGR